MLGLHVELRTKLFLAHHFQFEATITFSASSHNYIGEQMPFVYNKQLSVSAFIPKPSPGEAETCS
jgi:hypothetical protein